MHERSHVNHTFKCLTFEMYRKQIVSFVSIFIDNFPEHMHFILFFLLAMDDVTMNFSILSACVSYFFSHSAAHIFCRLMTQKQKNLKKEKETLFGNKIFKNGEILKIKFNTKNFGQTIRFTRQTTITSSRRMVKKKET